jgi:hypothetical protein
MVGDRQGGYTEVSLPKIPFWGVIRTIWLSNPLNGWVRRKYFYLRSCFGVLGGIGSVQLSCYLDWFKDEAILLLLESWYDGVSLEGF